MLKADTLWKGLRRLHSSAPGVSSRSEVTKLSNGLSVASENTPGHFVGLGVYIDAGTRYETNETSGVSHILDRMAFKATKERSSMEIIQTLEKLGGNIVSNSSRESIVYQGAVFQKDVDTAMELLAGVVRHPSFLSDELAEAKSTTLFEIRELAQKLDVLLPEHLHALAYRQPGPITTGSLGHELGDTIGRPLICTAEELSAITPERIALFRNTWFHPNKMVVAGIGLEHAKLVSIAEKVFGDMPPPSPSVLSAQTVRKPTYCGGIQIYDSVNDPPLLNPDEMTLTRVYIAFESPSMTDPDIFPLAVLNSMMGGGGAFSAGGPGKGMYTRLYTSVLNRHHWIESCHMFNYAYSDTGLFGITASVPPHPEAHTQVIEILCGELLRAATRIGDVELQRAKNQLQSNMLMSLESRIVELEDLGKQVGMINQRIDIRALCDRIQLVTKEDVLRVARKVIMGQDEPTPRLSIKSTPSGFSMKALYDLDTPWERHGVFSPTVLIHGPVADQLSPSLILEKFEKYGIIGKANSSPSPLKRRFSWL